MGGHFVQGHVDGTGEIVGTEVEGDSLWVKVSTDKELLKYIVPKGFIAVDGTSLTVVDVFDEDVCFNFMLVAYTQQKVVIPLKKVGQKVNLEVDILGKYVERLLSSGFVNAIKCLVLNDASFLCLSSVSLPPCREIMAFILPRLDIICAVCGISLVYNLLEFSKPIIWTPARDFWFISDYVKGPELGPSIRLSVDRVLEHEFGS
ncbi:unnamed protein product [Ilex paraguariensis]|uniref:Riboflavin synthase n=1 Tax=Ilex paraguariensis TaxID=185542 RepID=A0ABC8RUG7_9AQUA